MVALPSIHLTTGYGHATRVSAFARHLLSLENAPTIHIVSSAPKHVFADSIVVGGECGPTPTSLYVSGIGFKPVCRICLHVLPIHSPTLSSYFYGVDIMAYTEHARYIEHLTHFSSFLDVHSAYIVSSPISQCAYRPSYCTTACVSRSQCLSPTNTHSYVATV